MNLRSAAAAVWNRGLLVALAAVAAAALAVALTLAAPPRYTATARGFVSVSSPEERSPNVLTSSSMFILARMTSYSELATSKAVLDSVIEKHSLPETPQRLRARMAVTALVNTAFVEVRVTDEDPRAAARLADATVESLGEAVADLENDTIAVSLSDPGVAPSQPSNRNLALRATVAGGAGLVAAIAAAIGLGFLRGRRAHATAAGSGGTAQPATEPDGDG